MFETVMGSRCEVGQRIVESLGVNAISFTGSVPVCKRHCGGRGDSSYGRREQSAYAEEFYTTIKTFYVAASLPE